MPPRGPLNVLCVVVRHEIGIWHRARVHLGGHEPGDVRHVGDDRRTDRLADVGDARKIDDARVGARAHHDHLRLVLVREALHLVVIDPLVVFAHAVRHDRVELAGKIQGVAVREMTAVREVHAQHRVARLQQGEVHRHVRLRAGMRLDVGVFGPEQVLGAGDRERLGDVDELASTVVPFARIPFGVLVRHHRSGCFENGLAHEVLRRDELEAGVLPMTLVRNRAARSPDPCPPARATVKGYRLW